MTRLRPAALLLSLTLAGCTYDGRLSPHHNPTVTSVNEPVVERTDYVFDIGSSAGGVASTELRRLDAWFQSLGLRYGDRISLDNGYGAIDPASRASVASVAAQYGLLVEAGAPVTGQVQPGSLRVIVSRASASVPGCPNWDSAALGANTRTSPNYGCAVNTNIARMIADPNDLVLGRSGDSSIDAATAGKAIKAYRNKEPTGAGGLKTESTAGSGSSEGSN
jgi:pilus assembly protein CpaD